jgi:phosphatidylserine/phosphatidylglycerophosphate/cardiolipin synthase-like enzyme
MDGMLSHAGSKKEYGDYVRGCREASGIREEADVRSFFVPGQGGLARQAIIDTFGRSRAAGIAAHRFSDRRLREALLLRLEAPAPPALRIVVDDDVHWAGRGLGLGLNTPEERGYVEALAEAGAEVRYVETNHGMRQLHHNKFVVFDTSAGPAAFVGAGNFTASAFGDNLENFYFVTIPHVAEAMREQHRRLFEELGTPVEALPAVDVLPPSR